MEKGDAVFQKAWCGNEEFKMMLDDIIQRKKQETVI